MPDKGSKKVGREIKPPEEYSVDAAHPPAYAITRAILSRFLVPLLGGITVIGAENIPKRGPALLAPNHRAYTDPPYSGAGHGAAAAPDGERRTVQNPGARPVYHGNGGVPGAARHGGPGGAAAGDGGAEGGASGGNLPGGQALGTRGRSPLRRKASPWSRVKVGFRLSRWRSKGRSGFTRCTPKSCTGRG